MKRDLRTAEFLAVDTETNGRAGDACELTEVGAVLVGGGECHDRWGSLVAPRSPLSAQIQRFTGITQAMADDAPPAEEVLPELARWMEGRVLVAHNAAFDRRVLRQAFARAGLRWPNPPVLCTVAMARRFAPLAGKRGLQSLARAFDIDVLVSHRALPDAATCAQLFCALWPKLLANARTVGEAVAVTEPRRAGRQARRTPPRRPGTPVADHVDVSALPRGPGVYLFRDASGRALYVGKSLSIRTRARAHLREGAEWLSQARVVDHRSTASELGALVLENRLIKELRPPGNRALKRDDRFAYLRCRLDIEYPILEVAPEPAAGHAVNVGPLRGQRSALELKEQLESLFELRHCGRRLHRRPWPSAYGQMGRCLSPCLGDLDPNAYRRRLDAALDLFSGGTEGGVALLEHVEVLMGEAAAAQRFERAATLRRKRDRLEDLLGRLGGMLRALHADARLALAPHPGGKGYADALWLVGGRVVDWGPLRGVEDLERRTAAALTAAPRRGTTHAFATPADADEVRIVAGWLAAHDDVPVVALDPPPSREQLRRAVGALSG